MWKVTQTPEGQQVLTRAVKVLECRVRKKYVIHSVWGVLLLIAASPIANGQKRQRYSNFYTGQLNAALT